MKDQYLELLNGIESMIRTMSAVLGSSTGVDYSALYSKYDVEDSSEVIEEVTLPDSATEYRLRGSCLPHRKSGPAKIDKNGDEYWYQYGTLHRTDGPAIRRDGSAMYFKAGKRHRDDGPAIEINDASGIRESCWFSHGVAHRDGGPALILGDGTQVYLSNGHIHRADGPAIVLAGGVEIWVQHGMIHREDALAVLDGENKLYYHRNRRVDRPRIKTGNLKNGVNITGVSEIMAERLGGRIVHSDDIGFCVEDFDRNRTWYKVGTTTKHREGGPAVELSSGTNVYYINGIIHREDGPAITKSNGEQYWFHNGLRNSPNADTAAIRLDNGTEVYFKKGLLHRDGDLPAAVLVEANGDCTKIWAQNGKLHRDDISQPSIRWGSDENFDASTHSILPYISIPPFNSLDRYNSKNLKKCNSNEFYRDGKKIAESESGAQCTFVQMASVGDVTVSISGTSSVIGRPEISGLHNVEICGGRLTVKSTTDINISNCVFKDCFVLIDIPKTKNIVITGCYLTNSDLINVNNGPISEQHNCLNSTSKISHDNYMLGVLTDVISEQESMAAFSRRMDDVKDVMEAALSEDSFDIDEDKDVETQQLEFAFKQDHLMQSERTTNDIVNKIRDACSDNYVGEIKTHNYDDIESRIRNILDDMAGAGLISPDVNVSVDAEDGTKFNIAVAPPTPIQCVDIDFHVDEDRHGSTWATALAALGLSAVMSYLDKKPIKAEAEKVLDLERVVERCDATI